MNANVKKDTIIAVLVEEEYVDTVAPLRVTVKQEHTIKPRRFTGTGEDVETWLQHIEVLSQTNGWNTTEKYNNAVASLVDAAERFFHNNMTTVRDYPLLKAALEKHFGPANKSATNFQKMDLRKQTAGESIMSYFNDKKFLLDRYDDKLSPEQQIHFVIQGLLPDLRKRVAGNKLSSLDALFEKLKLIEEHAMMDEIEEQVFLAKPQQIPPEILKKMKCHYCQKEGHLVKDCFKKARDLLQRQDSFRKLQQQKTKWKEESEEHEMLLKQQK